MMDSQHSDTIRNFSSASIVPDDVKPTYRDVLQNEFGAKEPDEESALVSGAKCSQIAAELREAMGKKGVGLNGGSSKIDFQNTEVGFSGINDSELRRKERLFSVMAHPVLGPLGQKLMTLALKLHIPIEPLVKGTIFAQFCGGETLSEAEDKVKRMATRGVSSILDYAIEGEKTEAGFDATRDELLRVIETASHEPAISFVAVKVTGIGDPEILEKKQSGQPMTNKELDAFRSIEDRLDEIAARATRANVRIFVDAEESWIQGTIDDITLALMKKYNQKDPIVHGTFQMYRSDRLDALKSILTLATEEGFVLGLKLVRGAYMANEDARSKSHGTPNPIHVSKEATDQSYDAGVALCLRSRQPMSLCVATHNETSCRRAIQIMETSAEGLESKSICFAQLLGMSDTMSFNLVNAGVNVSKYLPYGPLRKVVPYLVRRARENSTLKGVTSRELDFLRREIEQRG